MPTKMSTKAPGKRLLSRIKTERATVTLPIEEAPLSPECEIFALAIAGGDGNRATVYERLRGTGGAGRRKLRAAIEWLDGLLDQVALDLHLERCKSKMKGGTKHNGSQ